MGAYLEDYVPGEARTSPGRTITEALVDLFAGLSGDAHPVHTDEVAAGGSVFGRRVAHGLLGMSVAFGLLGRGGQFEDTLLAHLGVQDWQFVKPIWLGDTIRARQVVVESRGSTSRVDAGVVTLRVDVVNQRDEVVQRGAFILLVKARSAAGRAAGR